MSKISPIAHHLVELRIRIMYIFFSIITTFICCYYYSEQIFYLLAKPLICNTIKENNEYIKFIYTDITEAFITYMKISLVFSLYGCFPVIIYQVWIFVIPGLYDYEKKEIGLLFNLSFLMFLIGSLIAYYGILPMACKFFISFEIISVGGLLNIHLQPKIDQYFFLVTKILLIFGVCFQFPIYLILLVRIHIIPSKLLVEKRNASCVIFFIIAAVLSPPDVLSQIILVVPLLFLYEITIFLIKLLEQYRILKKGT